MAADVRADCSRWIEPEGVEWQAGDMTAVVGAEARWDQLQTNGLWVAVDCLGDADARVGCLVSHNATGPLRLGFGGWRDLLLGCQFENGHGELITVGGRTVKNVAGYDLTKLMVGQSGVLGKILCVVMRVYRRPEDAVLAEFEPEMELFNRLLVSACRPQWAVLSEEKLCCGFLGDRRTVDYYQEQLPGWEPARLIRHGFEGDVKWRGENWRVDDGAGMVMRAAVPPMRMGEFAQRAGLQRWVGDAAFGIVLGRGTERCMAAAAEVGGRTWVWEERGGKLCGFMGSEGEREILTRIKRAMDGENRLAPLPPLQG